MDRSAIRSSLAALRDVLNELLDTDFNSVDENELGSALDALEVQRRRMDALDAQLIAAADTQHLAARYCRSSTADLLVHRLRVSPGDAAARVRRARDLGPRHSLGGDPLEPLHPVLASAQRDGQISARHADVATEVLEKLPCDISVEATPVAERLLVEAARHQHPAALARTGTMLLERLDPDGGEPDDERAYARRALRLQHRTDGTWTLNGELTDEAGLVLRTVLDPLAAPAPAVDGDRDPRTTAERSHDALLELCTQVLRAGTLPDAGGTPVTVLVRIDASDLDHPSGIAQTEHGDPIRMRTLIRLAGDADLVPVLFDRASSDCRLMLGRTRRLANRAQRRALAARDGGCCFPGCERPPSWCEVHHVVEWIAGGATDLDNLCLLCSFHHREFERRGWRVDLATGQPRWIPPTWIDPQQRPRTNAAHHLPDITFRADGSLLARARS